MSYSAITEGSEATPGLWNSRFQSIWSSLNTLLSGATAYSAVTGVRGSDGWRVETTLSASTLTVSVVSAGRVEASSISVGVVSGTAFMSFGTYFDAYVGTGASPNLQISPRNGATGIFTFSATGYSYFSGDGSLSMTSALWIGSSPVQVVGPRATGWSAPSGSPIRSTFDTSTATVGDVAQRLAALINDLTTHGLIGA